MSLLEVSTLTIHTIYLMIDPAFKGLDQAIKREYQNTLNLDLLPKDMIQKADKLEIRALSNLDLMGVDKRAGLDQRSELGRFINDELQSKSSSKDKALYLDSLKIDERKAHRSFIAYQDKYVSEYVKAGLISINGQEYIDQFDSLPHSLFNSVISELFVYLTSISSLNDVQKKI